MATPSERPPSAPPSDVTQLLLAWHGGDPKAEEQLLPAIYAELHRQAARAMRREGEDHTLQATALVHEAYLRLVDQNRVEWRSRAHFFGVAAQIMRRILVDHARGRHARQQRRRACAARSTRSAGSPRSAAVASRRIALLQRLEHRRDGGSAGHLSRHRQAGV